jgi:cyclopropane-fatty-acyl-phospholipid synthase
MATLAQLNQTYNYMDAFFRAAYGEHADISCARYVGDYTKTLEQAQADKHAYILEGLRFKPGDRVLDIGCGWGPMLCAVRERCGQPVGLTLASTQVDTCCRAGFEVYQKSWQQVDRATLGVFDAILSVGAFEHFCSLEDYLQGQQDEIYRAFFARCSDLLPPGRRLYLQTMAWGSNRPNLEEISRQAPRGSDAHLLAYLKDFYPGSFLPWGVDEIARAAAPHFRLVSAEEGRADYIATMLAWRQKMFALRLPNILAVLRTARYFLLDPHFGRKLELLAHGYQRQCFQREIITLYRLMLERT